MRVALVPAVVVLLGALLTACGAGGSSGAAGGGGAGGPASFRALYGPASPPGKAVPLTEPGKVVQRAGAAYARGDFAGYCADVTPAAIARLCRGSTAGFDPSTCRGDCTAFRLEVADVRVDRQDPDRALVSYDRRQAGQFAGRYTVRLTLVDGAWKLLDPVHAPDQCVQQAVFDRTDPLACPLPSPQPELQVPPLPAPPSVR